MKNYVVAFGSGDPSLKTGLTPTFTVFSVIGSGATTPPGITEIPSATGLYYFTYEPLSAIAFVIDGGTSLLSTDRFVYDVLDPIQAVDERVGTTGDTVGSTSADPSTIFGYVKRLQEFDEGNSTFSKTTGNWLVKTRGNTLLASKTLTDSGGVVSKT